MHCNTIARSRENCRRRVRSLRSSGVGIGRPKAALISRLEVRRVGPQTWHRSRASLGGETVRFAEAGRAPRTRAVQRLDRARGLADTVGSNLPSSRVDADQCRPHRMRCACRRARSEKTAESCRQPATGVGMRRRSPSAATPSVPRYSLSRKSAVRPATRVRGRSRSSLGGDGRVATPHGRTAAPALIVTCA